MLVLQRKENGEPGEKHSEQGENQQQSQPTYGIGPESNSGDIGGRLIPAPLQKQGTTLIAKLEVEKQMTSN